MSAKRECSVQSHSPTLHLEFWSYVRPRPPINNNITSPGTEKGCRAQMGDYFRISAAFRRDFAQNAWSQWEFPSVTVRFLATFSTFVWKWSHRCIACGFMMVWNASDAFIQPTYRLKNIFTCVTLMMTCETLWHTSWTLNEASANNLWDPKHFLRDLVGARVDISRDYSRHSMHGWPLEIFGHENVDIFGFLKLRHHLVKD